VEDDMPGAMRKMGVYLGLVEDADDVALDGADQYDRTPARAVEYAPTQYARSAPREPAVAPVREYAEPDNSYSADYAADYEYPSYRITTLHPRTYNEARTIGEAFRSGTPVIMNLSEMDDADAKRLVDFAAGLTFGLHGRIERITAKVFLLSPHNVTVTAQEKAKIAESGFFNQS
jgi:cell division inhibitor SepF